jgi:hypothetical protein
MSEVVHIGSLTDSVSISETGLAVVKELSFDQWSTLMGTLSRMDTAFQFALGDALLYGESRYGERYAQAVDVTGQSYQALANYVWVSKAVGKERRVSGLSWTHHRVVAKLDPEKQTELLTLAKKNDWTITTLMEEVRGEPLPKPNVEQVSVPKGMSVRDANAVLHQAANCQSLCSTCPFNKGEE